MQFQGFVVLKFRLPLRVQFPVVNRSHLPYRKHFFSPNFIDYSDSGKYVLFDKLKPVTNQQENKANLPNKLNIRREKVTTDKVESFSYHL